LPGSGGFEDGGSGVLVEGTTRDGRPKYCPGGPPRGGGPLGGGPFGGVGAGLLGIPGFRLFCLPSGGGARSWPLGANPLGAGADTDGGGPGRCPIGAARPRIGGRGEPGPESRAFGGPPGGF